MLKNIILHMGAHKTGSSAIQNTLHHNETSLAKQSIIASIRSFMMEAIYYSFYSAGQSSLISSIQQQFKSTYDFKKTKTLIISNEDLSFLNPYYEQLLSMVYKHLEYKAPYDSLQFHNQRSRCYSFLNAIFSDYKLSIVVYLRRQDLFIESLYCEYLKNSNLALPFNDFVKQYPIERLNWEEWIKTIKLSFPNSTIHVRVFEKESLYKQHSSYDFFHTLNINTKDLVISDSTINQRLRKDAIEIIRSFNNTDHCQRNLSPTAPDKLAQIIDHSGDAYGFFNDKQRLNFLKTFHQSNEAIKKQFFPSKSSEETLFKPVKPIHQVIQGEFLPLTEIGIKTLKSCLKKVYLV